MTAHRLRRLTDIGDGASPGLVLPGYRDSHGLLPVRQAGCVFACRNACSGTGGPLDWDPGQFMDLEGRHLICATHGALLRVADGLCIDGPCAGRSLFPLAVEVRGGVVRLKTR